MDVVRKLRLNIYCLTTNTGCYQCRYQLRQFESDRCFPKPEMEVFKVAVRRPSSWDRSLCSRPLPAALAAVGEK